MDRKHYITWTENITSVLCKQLNHIFKSLSYFNKNALYMYTQIYPFLYFIYCMNFLLVEVVPTADPNVAFKNVAAAFLVGAMPRKEGMERKDLLAANVEIFKVQGEALDKHARKDVKVLVVGNPANTNALICSHYAPSIPKQNFTAMTRLDQNRAQAALAAQLNVQVISFNVILSINILLPEK